MFVSWVGVTLKFVVSYIRRIGNGCQVKTNTASKHRERLHPGAGGIVKYQKVGLLSPGPGHVG